MTDKKDNPGSSPWWQSQLGSIQESQTAYLRRHLPALRADHEDLVGDTVLALTKQVLENASEYPASWFEPSGPNKESEESYLYKLAHVILKRRIADLFRKRQRESHHVSISDDIAQDLADPSESPDRKILLARLIKITSLVLDELTPEDRDLVALTTSKHLRKAVNPRDRKRLERIRRRLKNEISRRLGADVQNLLISL